MKKKKHVAFVIGFPGALAREVATALAEREDTSVKLLVPVEQSIEAEEYKAGLKRDMSIVGGSARKIDFGLSGRDYLELAEEVTDILQLDLPEPPGFSSAKPHARTAAREVIELALAAKKLKNAIVLSQLSVIGTAEGVFAEQDLELGQGFADHFQEDRFRSERVYRRFMDKLPITVTRAGWIAGSGPGLCPLIHLLLAVDDPASMQIKDSAIKLFAIDAKTLSDIIVGLIDVKPAEGGRTLHLAFRDLPKLLELIPMVKSRMQKLAPTGMEVGAGAKRLLRKGKQGGFWSAREFFKKQPTKAGISALRTEHFLAEQDLPIPSFDDSTLERLINEAAQEIAGLKNK